MHFLPLWLRTLVQEKKPVFAAAVKIDSFAYMPVQDFGNAFSTFVAQNFGARKEARIREGIKKAVLMAMAFCIVISIGVFVFAKPLMMIFVQPKETAILAAGVEYLRIEGAFYCGIGCLFLLYGFYRAVKLPGMSVVLTVISEGAFYCGIGCLFLLYGFYRAVKLPGMSVVLTVISLGTRVVLAYVLSSIDSIGVTGIWWSVPIGWALADLVGFWYYRRHKKEFETAWHVCGTYCDFTWYKSGTGLCTFFYRFHWSDGNLVVCAYWMGIGRSSRILVLQEA